MSDPTPPMSTYAEQAAAQDRFLDEKLAEIRPARQDRHHGTAEAGRPPGRRAGASPRHRPRAARRALRRRVVNGPDAAALDAFRRDHPAWSCGPSSPATGTPRSAAARRACTGAR